MFAHFTPLETDYGKSPKKLAEKSNQQSCRIFFKVVVVKFYQKQFPVIFL